MKRFKFGVKAAAFLAILILMLKTLEFITADAKLFPRIMMHEMYHQTKPIDVLFTGASTFVYSINPAIMDEKLNMNVFSMSSPQQAVVDTYYLLKEMYKYHSPQIVIIDIGPRRIAANMRAPAVSENLFDNYRLSFNKIMYLKDAFTSGQYLEALIPAARNRNIELLGQGRELLDNLKAKLAPEWREYRYPLSNGRIEPMVYQGKGYVSAAKAVGDRNAGVIERIVFYPDRIDSRHDDIYDKIIRLCRAHGSTPILLTMPYMNHMAIRTNLAYYSQYAHKLAAELNVEYYDFGLVKENIFQRKESKFYDGRHMNGKGGGEFSQLMAEFVEQYTAGELNREEWLYSSYEELLKEKDFIYSTWIEAEGNTVQGNATCGMGVIPEYQFLYRKAGETEFTVFREYSEVPLAEAPEEEKPYEVRVNTRTKGGDDFEQYFEMTLNEE